MSSEDIVNNESSGPSGMNNKVYLGAQYRLSSLIGSCHSFALDALSPQRSLVLSYSDKCAYCY